MVEQYKNHIYQTAFSVLRNGKDAEDATQEIFVKIYYALPQYSGKGFKTWATRIAINYSIDVKRKKVPVVTEVVDTEVSPINLEEEYVTKEKQQLVQRRLQDVPQNYRDVIVAFYIKEKTYEQIAREQQLEVKTVETKLYRARKWLKAHWKEDEFS
ncbi:sigma-70 family RNA polymerase sigma factor [Bacillus alkalicellulosilyticus]|uniref:sigma-70 family RNA polymerase sigma factor n=1 Tax=Alkalihalobacterium alkalicellulosilyticum TaxID=1912214 RepID=UPI003184526F